MINKIYLSVFLAIVICFVFVTKSKAYTALNIDTSDCSSQGGEDQVGNAANACDSFVDTSSTVYGWGSGHPAIHITAQASDIISISIQTPIFTPSYNYLQVVWSRTYNDWSGFIGGAWFGCNGNWGCDTITEVPPDNQSGFSGDTTFSGSTDYYVATIAHCSDVNNGCFAHITVSCTSCSVVNTKPSFPISKVFIVPGLGASWNLGAFANCKPDNKTEDWSLAPYAKDVYNPLISALPSKGFTAIPFYYDWRQNVKEISPLLVDSINKNTDQDEKIDLIGHSMGGLIGEDYLANQGGGKATKFLSVGTPNLGSALAYPAAVNGDVWFNDLTEKIAATLFINHCGIPDSINNLLPTYDYLKDGRTKVLKPVISMKTKNTLLPINLDSNFWGVKVGALVGSGFPTLKIIDTVKDSHWPDGKPVGKENDNDGDNTVLTKSAQIPGVTADVINQSHTGLIASDMGVSHILTFLGTPTTDDPNYSEHKSALVLIGYPGSFTVTDEKNNTLTSENGMISIMDPIDGNYQLQIKPTSPTTTFIIAQFLANGQTSYKEYKYKGGTIDPKVIEFNSKHVNDNPIHEVKEYKNPHFPKFWSCFWKFFNKK